MLALLALVATSTCSTALAEARAKVDSLDYDEAEAALLSCIGAKDATDDEMFDAHMLAGQVDVVLRKDVEARGHFLWALRRRPDAALPADAPAKVVTFFELEKDEAKREAAAGAPTTTAKATAEVPAPDVPHYDKTKGALVAGIATGCVGIACLGGLGTCVGPIGVGVGSVCVGAVAGGATIGGAYYGGNIVGGILPAIIAAVVAVAAGIGAALAAAELPSLHIGNLPNNATFNVGASSAAQLGATAGLVAGVVAGAAAWLLVGDPAPPSAPDQKLPASTTPGTAVRPS